MSFLHLSDRTVTYDTFVSDIAERVAAIMLRQEPQTISQNKAFTIFGRSNVMRWRRKGLVNPIVRPGKIEYLTADLRRMQRQGEPQHRQI